MSKIDKNGKTKSFLWTDWQIEKLIRWVFFWQINLSLAPPRQGANNIFSELNILNYCAVVSKVELAGLGTSWPSFYLYVTKHMTRCKLCDTNPPCPADYHSSWHPPFPPPPPPHRPASPEPRDPPDRGQTPSCPGGWAALLFRLEVALEIPRKKDTLVSDFTLVQESFWLKDKSTQRTPKQLKWYILHYFVDISHLDLIPLRQCKQIRPLYFLWH